MSIVSRAMRRRLSSLLMKCSVCMLCRRSASLTRRTRMSSDIARTSLRKFSACLVWSDCSSMRDSFDAIDEPADLRAELTLDILERGDRILDRVVQEARHDRSAVELHLGQEARHLDRMREIRVARGAQLRTMRLHRIDIGAVQQPLIRIGIVGFDQFDEFELPHHRAAAPILLRPNPVMAQPVYGRVAALSAAAGLARQPAAREAAMIRAPLRLLHRAWPLPRDPPPRPRYRAGPPRAPPRPLPRRFRSR